MRKLFHWPLDPAGRAIRLALGEKGLAFESVVSPPWQRADELKRLKPDEPGPVLLDQGHHGRVITVQTHATLEALEELYPDPRLLPALAPDRAEARRIWRQIEDRFNDQVNGYLLAQRMEQALERSSVPDSARMRQGAHALRGVLTGLNILAGEHAYLAGRTLSYADLVTAAQLSCHDYFGDIAWEAIPDLRQWYTRMKSRRSFAPLLRDKLPGAQPAAHYADLDF